MVRNTKVSTEDHTYKYTEMQLWILTLSSILAQFLKGKVISHDEVALLQFVQLLTPTNKMEWVTLTRKCQYIAIRQHLLDIKQNCRQSYVLEISFPYAAFYVINKEYITSTTSHSCNCFSIEDSLFHFICISVANWQSLEGILPCLSEWRTCSLVMFR